MKRLLGRIRDNCRGGTETISVIILLPLVFMLFATGVDTNLYFFNRDVLLRIAREGADTAATFGGVGDANKATEIEYTYGVPEREVCGFWKDHPDEQLGAFKITATAEANADTPVECNMINKIAQSGLVNVDILGVRCDPAYTKYIGERVGCEIEYRYNGVPMSAFTLLRITDTNPDDISDVLGPDGKILSIQPTIVRADADSEVSVSAASMKDRDR